MAVIKSSGDGCHIYGLKKMKTFPEWNTEDFPYVVLMAMDCAMYGFPGELLYALFGMKNEPASVYIDDGDNMPTFETQPGDEFMAYYVENEDVAATLSALIPMTVGEWTTLIPSSTSPNSSNIMSATAFVWSTFELVTADGTSLSSTAEPISVDGMTVIEWDGNDKENMTSFGGVFFKVDDTVLSREQFEGAFAIVNGEYVSVSSTDEDFMEEMGARGKTPGAICGFSTEMLPETGIYFMSDASSSEPVQTNTFAFVKVTQEVDPNFWNGVACGLNGVGVPDFDETTSFGKGYIAGCQLRMARPKIWLDNKLPFEFAFSAIKHNPVKAGMGGISYIKMSDLVLPASDFAMLKVSLSAADVNGQVQSIDLPFVMSENMIDGITMSMYGIAPYDELVMAIVSVSEEGAGVDADDIVFNEPGTYVLDFSLMMPGFEFTCKIEKPDGFVFVDFPLSFTLPGGLVQCKKATFVGEGASDAAVMLSCYKVFDRLYTVDELKDLYIVEDGNWSDGEYVEIKIDEASGLFTAGTGSTLKFIVVPEAGTFEVNSGLMAMFNEPGTYFLTISDAFLSAFGATLSIVAQILPRT